MKKKILITSIFATLMLLVPMTSVVGISNVEDNNQISILNPPQPSPIKFEVDFNITFYQPSSMAIKRYVYPPFVGFLTCRFSVIDFSNSPVGRIEYIERSTGSETTKTFTYFMFGFLQTGVPDLNSSHYNKSTGLGYIIGEEANLFYFGL